MHDICEILIDHQVRLVISGDIFDARNVSSLRKMTAQVRRNCRCRQQQSVSRDLLNVKSEGMHDICRISIDHQGCLVISSDIFDIGNVSYLRKNDGASPWQLQLPSTVEHQSPPSSFRNFAECSKICMFISLSICVTQFCIFHNTILHFAYYQHPPPDMTAMKKQKLTPATRRGK